MNKVLRTTLVAAAIFPMTLLVSACGGGGGGDSSPTPTPTTQDNVSSGKTPITATAGKLAAEVSLPAKASQGSVSGAQVVPTLPAGVTVYTGTGNTAKAITANTLEAVVDFAASSKAANLTGVPAALAEYTGIVANIDLFAGSDPVNSIEGAPIPVKVCSPTAISNPNVLVVAGGKVVSETTSSLDASNCLTLNVNAARAVDVKTSFPFIVIIGKPKATGATGSN